VQGVDASPSVAYQYSRRIVAGAPVVEEAAVAHNDDSGGGSLNGQRKGACAVHRRQASLAHRDAVLGLAAVEVGSTTTLTAYTRAQPLLRVWALGRCPVYALTLAAALRHELGVFNICNPWAQVAEKNRVLVSCSRDGVVKVWK